MSIGWRSRLSARLNRNRGSLGGLSMPIRRGRSPKGQPCANSCRWARRGKQTFGAPTLRQATTPKQTFGYFSERHMMEEPNLADATSQLGVDRTVE